MTVIDNTERKVAERELLQSNKNLESFSYSVSHDLRAPLRHMNGYANILREDYAAGLDQEGQRLVAGIVDGSVKMGKLIDDLLEFSRAGRQELTKSRFDMRKLAQAAAGDLLAGEPQQRNIEFIWHSMGDTEADSNLLRQVWVNLLSNALKYSKTRDEVKIEVGSSEKEHEIIYFVKDNGIGFDMKYYSKLFGVFQRLHRQSEFEGTGVGLALVKQIVERHGGSVWAESVPFEGSTFYFSLPLVLSESTPVDTSDTTGT